MPERAEIEAATLADAIFDELSSPGALIGGFDKATLCRAVTAALDRVRDVRDDDEAAELELLRDLRHRVIGFGDDDYTIMPWIDAHRLHVKGEPYIGCPFCRDQFVRREAARSPQGGVVKVEGDAMLVPPQGDDYGEIVSHHPEGPDQIVSPFRDGTVAVEDVGKRALEIAEGLRDDPQQERWVIAAYEEGSATLEGEPTPVCRVQGPSTSSQGVEVVPLGDLAWAIASAEFGSARAGESNER